MTDPQTTVPSDNDVLLSMGRDQLIDEILRLQTAINDAYRIMCSGTPPHSARETNARRVLRLAGVTMTEQSVMTHGYGSWRVKRN